MYKILTALEEAGRCQRGYFIESLGGAQFALSSTQGPVARSRRHDRLGHARLRRRRPGIRRPGQPVRGGPAVARTPGHREPPSPRP